MSRPWTKEEYEYLETNWGIVSMPHMCKKLGRSLNAIKLKAQRLRLGAFLEAGDYVSFNQLCIALGRGGGSGYMTKSWIEARGLPVKERKVNECSFKVVYLNDFWDWAEKNRTFIDFSKVEPLSLGAEPDWVPEQRKRDFIKSRMIKTTPWSKAEDEKLTWMVKQFKYGYMEISQEIKRSSGAIQRRLIDLGLQERPIKADNRRAWSDEEYQTFGDLIVQGYSYAEISEIIGRSDKALRGRAFDVYHTERIDELAELIGSGKWGDNAPAMTMQMLRREKEREAKKRLAEIAELCRTLRIVRNAKSFNGYWQKDICMNWHPVEGCKAGAENCDVCGNNFIRIKPQFCVRCGCTFYEREENNVCEPCRKARKKQAQRKFAVMKGGHINGSTNNNKLRHEGTRSAVN